MLKVNTKTNKKLLENFDSEQYPDISIVTSNNSNIQLIKAYLIDSLFFQNLEPNISEVNLAYLPESSLIRVLRALYGEELVAYSIEQLEELYKIIDHLQIPEYTQTICDEIRSSSQLMGNLEILQFCMENNLMVDQIKEYHFKNNLQALEDNRNFLMLNKISVETLVMLLVHFYEYAGEASHSIVNAILENYFNRNNMRPNQFFEEQDGVENLQVIWEQFHYSLQIDKNPFKKRSFMPQFPIPSNTAPSFNQQPKTSFLAATIKQSTIPLNPHEQHLLETKNARIQTLRHEIKSHDGEIQKLRKELYDLKKIGESVKVIKKPGGSSGMIVPVLMDEDCDDEEISILEGVKNSKKERDLAFSTNFDVSLSESETAFHRPNDPKHARQNQRPYRN